MTSARARLAALAVGLAVGAALVWPLAAWRLDGLALQNDTLRLQLEDTQHRLETLERNVGQRQRPVIASMDIETDVEDEQEQVALEGAIRQVAREFVGRPLDGMDQGLLTSTFDGRLVSAGDQVYRLQLSFALVAPHAVLVFHVVPVAPPG